MVELIDPAFLIEEEAPPLDISMPRVYRRRAAPKFTQGRIPLKSVVHRARQAHLGGDRAGFGQAYGQLVAEFQPAIQWALSCWEFLLSTEGCRFLPRSEEERMVCRGDYRAFMEDDFRRLVHGAFKECLLPFLNGHPWVSFEFCMRQTFWLTLRKLYRALEDPPNPRQRKLTPYSYLRCVPYQFLNSIHQDQVYQTVERLPLLQRQTLELYYLRFYKEEAAASEIQTSRIAFRRRRAAALRAVASNDRLSFALLTQIERY